MEQFETLVNYYGFSPVDFDWAEKRFWQQIVDLNPLNLIGENDGLYVVTRDPKLVDDILSTRANRVGPMV